MLDETDWNSPEFRCHGTLTPSRRHEVERQKLFSAFPYVAVGVSDNAVKTVGGAVETFSGRIRDFRLAVPSDFPYAEPRAYPVGWPLSGPHQYPEERMCLWPVNYWKKHYTVAFAVAKTMLWIHKHELYLHEGKWLGNEVKH